MTSTASDGHTLSREHADPHAGGQPALRVDRRRIVHSAAFRRLQHKTQAFVAGAGDHFRTRLTHTLEVADLARSIAGDLGLDADLAETVALAHDLGHPPFGHAGEMTLNDCLRDCGGFEHNVHALRVVDYLEHPYPEFRGLNLTRVVRECLAKHTTRYDRPGAHPLQDGEPPPLEGQVAAIADRLTYGLHDLQDGLYADLLQPAELKRLELWRRCGLEALDDGPREARRALRSRVDRLRSALADGVVEATRRKARAAGVDDLGRCGVRLDLVALPEELEAALSEFEAFLLENVYRSQAIVRMDAKARRVLTAVFEAYLAEPRLMPPRFARRVGEEGAARVAGDYIAGMTDLYCQREHARLFDARMDA
ncbi:MAG: dNTP triphosphohydrolase [Planctomycetota bacterium]|nr:MAG: dNTP triphosphohydrolase [Planctomycetota bacterium]